MKTPSSKAPIDVMKTELDQVLASLGHPEITEQQKTVAYARISELTDEIMKISKRDGGSLYIINILPKKFIPNGAWRVGRSYASFQIPGREDDAPYSVTEVTSHIARIDTGRGGQGVSGSAGWRVKLDSFPIAARDVANDIAREINGDLPSMESGSRAPKTLGVFVSPTRIPSPEQLESERSKLNVYLSAWVSEGNAIWRKTKDYRKVSDISRMAAELLNISTDWHENFASLIPCPACGTKIAPDLAKCSACSAILDREKAMHFGLIPREKVERAVTK